MAGEVEDIMRERAQRDAQMLIWRKLTSVHDEETQNHVQCKTKEQGYLFYKRKFWGDIISTFMLI